MASVENPPVNAPSSSVPVHSSWNQAGASMFGAERIPNAAELVRTALAVGDIENALSTVNDALALLSNAPPSGAIQALRELQGELEASLARVEAASFTPATVTPPPQPTAQNPIVTRDRWSVVGETPRERDMARLQDLLTAFKQLDVPVSDQIAILRELHATGRLHAELVID